MPATEAGLNGHLTVSNYDQALGMGETDEWTNGQIAKLLGTTVFHGTRNFEPSRRICQLPRNFYVFAEFCGIRY